MGGLGAWGGFLERLIKKLPIQDRKERWKNELDRLKRERDTLLAGTCRGRQADRLAHIIYRINELTELLLNSSND